MLGIATIDRQQGSSTVVVWLTSRLSGVNPTHVNAVELDLRSDPEALRKLHSLTRERVVLATEGTAVDGLPITGTVLTPKDLEDLVAEVRAHQVRILEAIRAYQVRTRSKSVVEPSFPVEPSLTGGPPLDNAAVQRALALANYASTVWSLWLKTDEERRRRTVHPKTQASPWIMPSDMSAQETPDFPSVFSSRIEPQPLA